MDLTRFAELLSRPYTRAEVLTRPSPVPSESGLYAWTFREGPSGVPLDGCAELAGRPILYVGIAPSRSSSRRTLRDRVRTHYAGNASGSTLRLTLGCLLGLNLEQRGGRLTFGADESVLSSWMESNALVSWLVHPRPWEVEFSLLALVAPPLNIEGNTHSFVPHLRGQRAVARDNARARREGVSW